MDKINIAAFKGHVFCTLIQTEMVMSKISEDDNIHDATIKNYISISKATIDSLREILKTIKEIYEKEDIPKEIADMIITAVLEDSTSTGNTLYDEINNILSMQEALNDVVGR